MNARKLGRTGPVVSKIGLGAVAMSDLYGHERDDNESVATLGAAVGAGITLLDTGDFYGSGHNEMLIEQALRDRSREEVTISVKFGARGKPPASVLHAARIEE